MEKAEELAGSGLIILIYKNRP